MFEFAQNFFRRDQPFCVGEFPQIWASFIDAFIDTIHAQGPAATRPTQIAEPVTFLPAAERIVAIGDLHGDVDKTKRALRLGGLIDEAGNWTGGHTVAVQVGDQLDRGGNEVEILYLLERLQKQAARAGGALHVLNGNHEFMNIAGDVRYATQQGSTDFLRWRTVQGIGDNMKSSCGCGPAQGWCSR
ncbi:hypothetical protein WJX84_003916 [Apatococcus fuscideae]|uniref:Calcineurin-like phosphoesterase domain-containing protein n=1 Tax=Apatococcus fuscideae TaxID=2026836 RepID=A0AAW1SVC7_9CHLO